MKKTALITVIALLTITACKKSGVSGYEQTKDGVLYKIIDSKNNPKAQMGDLLTVSVTERTQNDSLVWAFHSHIIVSNANFKGDPAPALTLVGVGDSISFMVPVDSIIRIANSSQGIQNQINKYAPFKKHGDYVRMDVKVIDLKTADQVKSAMAARQAQAATDQQPLDQYLSANNLKPQKTASGLYYIIDKKGKGPLPKMGQTVTVNYTGKLLDGTIFDSSLNPGRGPFSFQIGGNVIKGWNEGIPLFPVGSKGRLFIPSDLAYGPQGNPSIPPNAPLIFEIEVLSAK